MDERTSIVGRPLSPRVRALYPAGVVGLAVFVSLALLFPEPICCYLSRAVIEQSADSNDVQEPVETPLLTLSEVERLARESFLTPSSSDGTASAFGDTVKCQVEHSTPHRARVSIETRDRFADQSLELCRQLSGDLVERAEKSFVPGLNALRSQRSNVEQRLALVRESKRAAEDELTSLEREHLAEVSAALVAQLSPKPEPGSAGEELFRLEGEWQRLLAERRDLSRTRTDDHPQVRDIDERLEDVKGRIDAATPRTPASQATSQLQDQFRLRARELSETIAQARRREDDLLSEAARLAVTPEPIALHTRIVQAPQVVERSGGRPSLSRIAILCGLALAASGLTFGLLRHLATRKTLRSANDVQAQLGLPVLSLVADPAAEPSTLPWDRIARRSVMAAEILLLVLSLSAALLTACQSQLTRPAGSDPFGAVAESLDRTLSPTLRR